MPATGSQANAKSALESERWSTVDRCTLSASKAEFVFVAQFKRLLLRSISACSTVILFESCQIRSGEIVRKD